MIRAWMWVVWGLLAFGVIVLAIRERRTKGTYWWEPNSNPWAWVIVAPLTIGAILVARSSDAWRPFIIGTLLAICVPAFLTGIWYRIELAAKGLKPRWRQGTPSSSDAGEAGAPRNRHSTSPRP